MEAICGLLGCAPGSVEMSAPGRFRVNGQFFFVVGPGAPAGLPAEQAITLVGERAGFRIYTLQ